MQKNAKITMAFLQSPHQVDMKNVVECWKEFFAYFNALETHSGFTISQNYKLPHRKYETHTSSDWLLSKNSEQNVNKYFFVNSWNKLWIAK